MVPENRANSKAGIVAQVETRRKLQLDMEEIWYSDTAIGE